MENSEPTQPGDTRPRPGAVGCNLMALALLLVALVAFAIAAWVNSPEQAPAPSSTGVPPTPPG